MTQNYFDPYIEWLGIRDPQRPPNHYCLLGITEFEDNVRVVTNAADRQMAHVRTFQTGEYSVVSQRLLNELTAARICLLNPQKKAQYDAALHASRAPAIPVAPPTQPPVPVASHAPPSQQQLFA